MSTDYQTILDQTRAAADSAAAAAVKTKSDREAIEALVLEINEEQAISIKNSKEAIRKAIVAKGQSCSTSVPFEEYANKISAINSESSGGTPPSSDSSSEFEPGFDGDGYTLYSRHTSIGYGSNANNNLSMFDTWNDDTHYLMAAVDKYKFKLVSLDEYYAAAIGTDNNLYIWGRGQYPEHFSKNKSVWFKPYLLDDSGNWKYVFVTRSTLHAINTAGDLYFMGNNGWNCGGSNKHSYGELMKVSLSFKCKKVLTIFDQFGLLLSEDGKIYTCGRTTQR